MSRYNYQRATGGVWWERAVASGYYQTGQIPNCGAVICFSDNNGGAGHVAIVEVINEDGRIRCSNSAWQSTYFWISDITPVNRSL
ncbi:MAG: CHAP domain-containing protein [Clostridia bacterium]